MGGGDGSPSVELYRAERAKLARLERLEREQVLTRIEDVNETLTRILSVIRGAGELLQRQFGPEAHAVLDDAIDALIREIPNWTFEGDLYAEQETTSHAAS